MGDNLLVAVLALIIGLAVILLIIWLLIRNWIRQQEHRQEKLLQLARQESEDRARELREEAERQIERRRKELEEALACRERQIEQRERELEAAELKRSELAEALENRSLALDRKTDELEKKRQAAEQLGQHYRERLQKIASLTDQEVREALFEQVKRECEDELRQYKQEALRRSESEVEEEARRILIDCMQRLSVFPQQDISATIVPIPSEDMKGRIIGREGRNIKSFESSTGTTLLIDETPDSVLISCFDPVRREIARIALESLIRDGRIHPSSIEQAVDHASEEIKKSVTEYAEDALRRVRLHQVHPEVVQLLGKLRYRLSNNQNSLDHSVEVANLCALMAAELGLDTELAKRAGLFHDIGKSLDAEYEGSHAIAGANILKRVGEDDRVVNAVAAHHEEEEAQSPYAALLKIADTISAVRPGARAESIDSYIQRVKKLEELAKSMKGVTDAFAIQAGREIRVIVSPDDLSDDECRQMARKLRRRVEDELQYPGTIRITVIRESRFSEQAR